MRTVTVEQHYEASLDRVLDAFTQPDIWLTFQDFNRIAPVAVLSREQRGDVTVYAVRYKFIAPLSPAVTRVVDRDKITWVQTHTVDRASRTEHITFDLDHYADKLRFKGGHARYATPSEGHVNRTLVGTFGVELGFMLRAVQGPVENALVSGLEDHFGQEERMMRAHLASGA